MSEINVQVRVGTNHIFNTKVYIDLNDTVLSLKKAICKIKEQIVLNRMTLMYCGIILEDSQPLHTYELFSGCTVFVFQKIKTERKATFEPINDVTIGKLARGFRSLLLNSEYRNSLSRLCRPEVIHILLHNNPGLVEDPIALTLFQHPELLMKITDYETIKNLAQNHPALASIILHVTETAQNKLLQNQMSEDIVGTENNPVSNTSDEDDDLDDSNLPGQSNGHPYSNVVLGEIQREITAAQLASAIANATAQQSQPSTSGASTSTGSTGNAIENAQSPTTTELILPTQLQIMRDMGLTNEAVNIAALRISNDLETAIDLVLSGFTNP
ncbi:UBA-like,Ubiquitin-related domain,Ubiquitin domain [Cinara cedri]|uniref:UBA-like,Ubiquitin-related domain,Ubiquitin domain n=1 Tax=Cinara cedri TaxID=506608 RepID=A0A5E4LXF1_9HEMI|nr:UBA-like,Ubiquitin-related domain,Ubiquitin domain [Cinara cedri]